MSTWSGLQNLLTWADYWCTARYFRDSGKGKKQTATKAVSSGLLMFGILFKDKFFFILQLMFLVKTVELI